MHLRILRYGLPIVALVSSIILAGSSSGQESSQADGEQIPPDTIDAVF